MAKLYLCSLFVKYLQYCMILTILLDLLIINKKKIAMERKNSDNECPVRKSMHIFAGKWTLLIIYQINSRIVRYGELKRAIPGISEKMLINELKFLCDKGLIAKKQYPEVPPRVEYSLTPLGEKVLPIIDEIARFGMENL